MLRNRYRRILWFFAKVILSLIWWDIFLPRIGFRKQSQQTRTERLRRIAAQFRALAVDMGGVMIKMGQFLSTRLDILPHEITDELTGLQDEVRPERIEDIRTVIHNEMNAPLDTWYSAFEAAPLASASIGQVHRARLQRQADDPEDTSVVVKVQRPLIQDIVDTDLAALRVVSEWVQRYPPIRKRANMPALLAEFSRSLYEEIDYLREGSNAETFAANFAGWPDVRVPHVYWNQTTRRVLTLEEIQGIKITDHARIDAAGISRKEIAQRLFQTYMKQVFEDRFYHADPHPGNLFILPLSPKPDEEAAAARWQLVFVDFGMTGAVTPNQLTALREILIGVGTQDIPRLIRAYQIMGVLLPGADVDLLEKATRRVFDRFWGKSTTEMVNMGHQEAMAFVEEFGDLMYELPFQVPENLLLLGRGLSILSGICTGLDPDFNVWTGVMPYAEKLIADESGRGGKGKILIDESLDILKTFISLPKRTEALLQRIEQGKLEMQIPELRSQIQRLDRHTQRIYGSVLFASFFFGGIQFYLAQAHGPAWACGIAAVILLLWILGGR